MAKISMKARKEITGTQKQSYQKASKKKKGEILDSVCEMTGLSRDRAARILRGEVKPKGQLAQKETRGRKAKYDYSVLNVLKKIWAVMDCACGKRIAAGMNDILDAMIRFGEISADKETIKKLREVSPATIDRLLSNTKKQFTGKGRSTTKPGTLLKQRIAIRTGTEWDENRPGFMEIDLVAHCGATTAGEYINTLNVTDVCTGWTETQGVINKAQKHVFTALIKIRGRLPFALLGVDSDNGGEFINDQLYRYCKAEGILFTRSRPYRKNDNCYVEQKNYSIVRKHIGYERYESSEALILMNEYYGYLRLKTNYFMPSLKLESKRRDGAKIVKKHEKPKTPYQRLLESKHISIEQKKELKEMYLKINPVEITRKMEKILRNLEKEAVVNNRKKV